MMLVLAVLAGALLVPLRATGQEIGMMFVAGPNFLTPTQRMTFKLQNLYRTQLVFAVAILAANGTLPFYQKVTVQPNSVLDVLVPVACAPCTPIVFLANGQLGPGHKRLPLLVSMYLDTTAPSNPTTVIPWELWAIFYAASLSANSIDFGPKFDKDDGCMSWSPGPVRLPTSNGVFIAANYGGQPVEVKTACTNSAGQPLQGCRQTTTIQPLHTAMIQLAGALQMLPFIIATPGTLGLNFAVLQFTGPHFSIFQYLMIRTPKFALLANDLECSRAAAALN